MAGIKASTVFGLETGAGGRQGDKMKQWLSMFTAVLAAGLVVGAAIFGWARSVSLWENRALARADSIRETIGLAEHTMQSETAAADRAQTLKVFAQVLEVEADSGQRHLKRWAPMRNEATLLKALETADEARKQISAAVDLLEKEAVAQVKAAEEARARTLEGWTEIAGRHVETINGIVAALPNLQGKALRGKKAELDTAVTVAAAHLKIAPGWSDPGPLRKALELAAQALQGAPH